MKRDKLIELIGTILRGAIVDSPNWNVVTDAIRLAESDPNGQIELICSAIDWLKNDFYNNAKSHNQFMRIES